MIGLDSATPENGAMVLEKWSLYRFRSKFLESLFSDGAYESKCLDGSHEIKPTQGGDCGEGDLMCKGRDGSKWEKVDVCVKEVEVRCDGVLHCGGVSVWKSSSSSGGGPYGWTWIGGEDEANCTRIRSKVIGLDPSESEEEEHEYYSDDEHVACD